MKQLLSLILTLMLYSIASHAQSSNTTSNRPIGLQIGNKNTNPIIHRAPVNIHISATYDDVSNSIEITYYGNQSGEIFLYVDNCMVEYSDNLNTVIYLPDITGTYTIEIVGESWIAIGYLEI